MTNAAFYSTGVLLFAFSAAGQSDQQIAALQQEQLNHHRWGYLTVSANRSYIVVTVVEDATRLEDQLNHDPENVVLLEIDPIALARLQTSADVRPA